MVVRNKVYKVVDRYKKLLKANLEAGTSTKSGVKTKNKVLDSFLKNNRWPSRLSKSSRERKLAASFENYVSKESGSYDSHFRRLAFATGRKTNNKSKHNIQKNKKDVLAFVKKYGRAPTSCKKYELVTGESLLRHHLDYYTKEKNDTNFLSKVYALDKCHRSGIPSVYRPIINQALKVKKPLIRIA